MITKLDVALNKRLGYESNQLAEKLRILALKGSVEVGWRESCGCSHMSLHTIRAWRKLLAQFKKDGLVLCETSVKHKNAYASNNGGFWRSSIFSL